MPIINRSYFDAAQKGRDAAQQEQSNALLNQARQQNIEQTGYENNLARQNAPIQADAAKAKEFATQMTNAIRYAKGSTNPKALIEKNFPLLVETFGPEWATATDDQVRAELDGAEAKFGTMAGIAPEQHKGAGALYKIRDPKTGKPIYGNASTADGQTPYMDSSDGPSAPSGYRFKPDGTLAPIDGGPADPRVASNRNPNRVFQMADKLRDEFNALNKDFITVGDNYNIVRETAKDHSAAGDLSMIFAYMKMLDPNSVVREQEFANAQNAAGVPERVANAYNKLLSGERLNEQQRADFINQAKNLYGIKKKRTDGVTKRYTDIATRNGVNPQDVVGDLSVFEDPAPGPTQPAPAAGGWSIKPLGGR
jgi:hypothetical protein